MRNNHVVVRWFVICHLLALPACMRDPVAPAPAGSPHPTPLAVLIGSNVWFQPDSENIIAVRDFDVELRDGDSVVTRATTGAEGHFRLTATAGRYRLCWKRQHGWQEGCAPQTLLVRDRPVVADELFVSPEGSYVWGTAVFRNGTRAVHRDPRFGVTSYPVVDVVDGPSTLVNSFGEYVLPGISQGTKEIRIRAEGGVATAPLTWMGRAAKTALNLPNPPPAAHEALRTAPGEILALTAKLKDAGHDALAYRWEASSGRLSSTAGESVTWSAPASAGTYEVHVLGSDGKGGFVRKTFAIQVNPGATVPPGCVPPTTFFTCPPGDAPAGVQCASGDFLSRRTSTSAASAIYYANIDPKGNRATLQQWWKLAGFDTNGGGTGAPASYAHTSYANANDLGFGRDMHMIETTNGIFAYVTNYLNQCRLQDPGNVQLAVTAKPADAIATVCMEYSSPNYDLDHPDGSDRIVKFLVYGADGKISTTAALDPSGLAPIPNLCLNCHGGKDYDETLPAKIDLKARFLPFDLSTFQFDPSLSTPDYKSFHNLNNLVLKTLPISGAPAPPIAELINLWYSNPGSDIPETTRRPGDWDGAGDARKKLYDLVVARNCRTCHMAFDSVGSPTWSTYSEFLRKRPYIKRDTNRGDMPHALITFMNLWSKNFWTDGKGQKALKCFNDSADEAAMEACFTLEGL